MVNSVSDYDFFLFFLQNKKRSRLNSKYDTPRPSRQEMWDRRAFAIINHFHKEAHGDFIKELVEQNKTLMPHGPETYEVRVVQSIYCSFFMNTLLNGGVIPTTTKVPVKKETKKDYKIG